ncbi:general substrate transporter [Atractiella rhizophila]|nr:general substrate transporter [Atractiella rhizophila]
MSAFIKAFGNHVEPGTVGGAIAIIDGETYQISSTDKSLITSFLSIGTFLGALAGGWIADAFGRRGGIIISGLVFLAGVTAQTACMSIPGLCAGRVVAGLGVGIISMMVPMYQAEAAPPHVRGALISLYQLAITLGICVAQTFNFATADNLSSVSWRVPIGIQIAWGIILIVGVMMIPESPRYLVKRGMTAQALKNLAKMRARGETTIAVREEFSDIINNYEYELSLGPSTYAECFRGTMRNRTLIGINVQMFQQFTGINFIFYFGTTYFENAGISAPFLITIATGIVNVFFTLPGIWMVEHLGRRTFLLGGSIVMCVAQFLIGIVAVTKGNETQSAKDTLVAFTLIFIAAFAATWGPGAWVLTGEVFPLKLRGRGMSLSAASNWFWNWIIAFIVPYLSDKGYAGLESKITFVWGSLAAAGFVWAWFFVPETRGLTLEELDEMFESRLPAWETAKFKPSGLSTTNPHILSQMNDPTPSYGQGREHREMSDFSSDKDARTENLTISSSLPSHASIRPPETAANPLAVGGRITPRLSTGTNRPGTGNEYYSS